MLLAETGQTVVYSSHPQIPKLAGAVPGLMLLPPKAFTGHRFENPRSGRELHDGIGVNRAQRGMFAEDLSGSTTLMTRRLALADQEGDNPCFAIVRKARICWTV